ncbi:MAG: amidase [Geminicoccaceae bacterium]|nr:amidase [Geminicoccaceae bacterium]
MAEKAETCSGISVAERDRRIAEETVALARRLFAEHSAFGGEPADFAAALERLALDAPPPRVRDAAAIEGIAREPILDLTLAELARAIRAGAISACAATEASLAALETHGRALGAVARLWPERALARAEELDRERAAGRLRGPLHGVPLAHKDMFARAGERDEWGTTVFRDRRAERTASVIERLDAAGAVDLGRLNMVEFALGITGHNPHTGHPKNPWDPRRITGGSSSGSAAAVAARCVFGSLGSDTGGSIRVPASLCGLVGLKPTYGRVSRAGAMPLSFSLDHIGPLARSAEDAALLLAAIAGRDPRDPTTSERPVPDFAAHLGSDLEGVRIGIARGDLEVAIDPEIAALKREAAVVLRDLGARVEELAIPALAPVNALRRIVLTVECAALHRELVRTRASEYNPETLARMAPGFAFSAVDYLRALVLRAPLLERFVAEVFARCDLLALPTCPVRTPEIVATDTGGDDAFIALSNAMAALVGFANYLGLPAVSVPMGFDSGHMPVGLQLVGPPFAEGLLLRAAHAFERATGYTRKAPGARL